MKRGLLRLACVAGAWLPAACTQPVGQDKVADGRFDGVYAGTRTEETACGGEQHAIVFHVTGSRIAVESRHKHRRLTGTVAADGSITLTDAYGVRQIAGTIGADRLEATEAVSETIGGRHRQAGENDPIAPSCLWRFEAVRTADAVGSGSDGPSD